MSTTYEPGTVAVATVRGVPNVRVMLLGASDYPEKWASGTPVHDARLHEERDVTDVRPLVVLDLVDVAPASFTPPSAAEASLWLRRLADKWGGSCAADVARAIADQIEAQTKPPKPAEPTGLGAVVEAEDGRKYVRTAKTDFPWVDAANPGENAYHWTEWGGLPTPPVRVISEGVES